MILFGKILFSKKYSKKYFLAKSIAKTFRKYFLEKSMAI